MKIESLTLALTALNLLMNELVASGNARATDFGWPAALKAAEAAKAAIEADLAEPNAAHPPEKTLELLLNLASTYAMHASAVASDSGTNAADLERSHADKESSHAAFIAALSQTINPVKEVVRVAYSQLTPIELAQWVPITEELLSATDYDQVLWIACKDGSVVSGKYKWRQGHNPDRFIETGCGDMWAYDATHIKLFLKPGHPANLNQG